MNHFRGLDQPQGTCRVHTRIPDLLTLGLFIPGITSQEAAMERKKDKSVKLLPSASCPGGSLLTQEGRGSDFAHFPLLHAASQPIWQTRPEVSRINFPGCKILALRGVGDHGCHCFLLTEHRIQPRK